MQQDDQESGLKILRGIAKKNQITLEAQRELVEQNKSASETAAAKIVNGDMEKMRREMEEKVRKEREEAEREIARQETVRKERLRQDQLEMERIAAERRREEAAERKREEERRAGEEAVYWGRYWREQRELEEAERDRRRQEQDRLERELQEIERQRQVQQEAEEARQRYYRNYVCIGISTSSKRCDKCYSRLHSGWTHYYREMLLC